MRAAFRVVRAVPRRPEGDDLRLGPHAPDDPLYAQARELAAALADARVDGRHRRRARDHGRGHRGRGPRARRSASTSACRSSSEPTPFIAGDPKLVDDEVLLHPQAHADEGVDGVRVPARRLRHARRGLRAAHAAADGQGRRPRRSCCSTCPGGTYWTRWRDFVVDELAGSGLIADDDLDLFLRHRRRRGRVRRDRRLLLELPLDALRRRSPRDPAAARPPDAETIEMLERDFADISHAGWHRASSPRCPRRSRTTTSSTSPRLAFRFDRNRLRAAPRRLIDALNASCP